ncbi:MAG: protein kinase [Clostridium tyrobutyricum]|jgi:serine/threonine-protein kinase|uniref:serine/threonine protein kinase n=1 Tax=Clostridium tyrobutyricum TaxID=1519 RepID=UPI00243236CC|nr:protein kinase [Clostridium tyrobutyricum]MCH4201110.1 protein kinase [Clostridium tyrobutyricum]MCH4238494.1 protein kinase [Clostridium tyrobutyricum]MCH4260339.1 protein kinase [Clostridium tyrobutyricum]
MISFFSRKKYPSGFLIDGYKIIRLLGEGRFGICYLVDLDGKQYVLKEIKPKAIKKNDKKVVFEEKILLSIDNVAIPKIIDTIKNGTTYAYILEYKSGKTIEDMIFGDKHRFTNCEIYKIGIKLIDIMKYLHRRNIVHRDIRVPNVIVDKDSVYLVDFGLARLIDNKKYAPYEDFLYFGHLLLHLYYSSFIKINKKSKPWYEELELSSTELKFLKKLLGLDEEYENIYAIEKDFLALGLI